MEIVKKRRQIMLETSNSITAFKVMMSKIVQDVELKYLEKRDRQLLTLEKMEWTIAKNAVQNRNTRVDMIGLTERMKKEILERMEAVLNS